jgi:HEPN domain-containing protein
MDEAQKELLRSWLTKALNDLKSARVLGNAEEGPLDTAIYHCQQTAEKAVKAFLVFHGVTPEKTHDIRKLALEASSFDPDFNGFIPIAAALTPYAWEFRYPDDLAETYPTREEFDEAFKQARAIYDFVLGLIPPEAKPD